MRRVGMKRPWITESIGMFVQSIYGGMQLGYGIYRLSRLRGPIVSIFGGNWVDSDDGHAKQAHKLAGQLVGHGFSILTGGGLGIMSAANCGAQEKKEQLDIKEECTLGISVVGVDVDFVNPCADVIQMRYFFSRKWLLIRYSSAIVVFPGGIGTVDELFDVLNLQKFGRVTLMPIILVNRSYWKGLIDWYGQSVSQGIIRPEYGNLFTITDNIDEVYSLISTHYDKK